VLPIINGPNEGIAGVMFLYVVTGILGTNIWTEKMGSYKLNEIALVLFAVLALFNSLLNVISAVRRTKGKMSPFVNLITLIYMIVIALVVCYLSPSNVISRKPRILIYFFGFIFSKLVGLLQVSHVTRTPFNQFNRTIFTPITLLLKNVLIGYFLGECPFNEDRLIDILCIFAILSYAHFAFNVIRQFCGILNIRVFSVDKPTFYKTS